MDHRAPDRRDDEGFVKLSWAAPIARMTSLSTGAGHPIDAATWAGEGYPTPRVVTRVTGDDFYRSAGSSTIYYAGPTMNRAITAQEWAAAGRPAPRVVGTSSGSTSSTSSSSSSTSSSGTGSSGDTYVNSDGQRVHVPVAAPSVPGGASAQCRDGDSSFSQHHSGTCSGHGGVARWL